MNKFNDVAEVFSWYAEECRKIFNDDSISNNDKMKLIDNLQIQRDEYIKEANKAMQEKIVKDSQNLAKEIANDMIARNNEYLNMIFSKKK